MTSPTEKRDVHGPASSKDVHVFLNGAISLDGYTDNKAEERLILSNSGDWEVIDELRAWSDAILVGANTIRRDNCRLLIRSDSRQTARIEQGHPPHPAKVTITKSGNLDPTSEFFVSGESEKIVYCTTGVEKELKRRLKSLAEIVPMGPHPIMGKDLLDDMASRNIRRLLIEGGSSVATMFLTEGLVNELRIAIAPFFVGESSAPRFTQTGNFPHSSQNRMKLKNVEQFDDLVAVTYDLKRLDS